MSHRLAVGPEHLERLAAAELTGVGDATLGEWAEVGRVAFHVRRRLSAEEAAVVGPVKDIRGTPEAGERIQSVWPWLEGIPADVIRDELGA